jgi:hypothetical protein
MRSAVGERVSVLLLALLLAGCTVGAADASRVVSSGIPGTVTVAHERIRNAEVDLLAIPEHYTPAVGAQRALTLALAELGPSIHPTSAHLYRGAFMEHGTPGSAIAAWSVVITYATPCIDFSTGGGSPLPGSSPQRPMTTTPGACRFGVVLDARSGDLIVEGP